jgi:hypothetical protein
MTHQPLKMKVAGLIETSESNLSLPTQLNNAKDVTIKG